MVSKDFPQNIDRAVGSWPFISAYRGWPVEYAQSLAQRPTAQITDFQDFLNPWFLGHVDRYFKVDLLSPGVNPALQGQLFSE
jgi:hypothetical protein